MDDLRVRVYNVRFGDAILISVPDAEDGQPKLRHILIDVGNALAKAGGRNFVFRPVIEDILAELSDAPVDLYIMTHEHWDHIEGLYHWEKEEGGQPVKVEYSWLTASSEPGYYDRDWPTKDEEGNPIEAPKRHELELGAIERFAAARAAAEDPLPPLAQMLLAINGLSGSDTRVDYLRKLAQVGSHFVFRKEKDGNVTWPHPFEVAQLTVWAPEENTGVYRGRFRPMALGLSTQADGNNGSQELVVPIPPPGVDAGAFYRLVEARQNGYLANLRSIDESKNNSSIVFCLEWHGWRLLFPGDAEDRSWREMNKHNVLAPVHFVKISHHASFNGTPRESLLEKILPVQSPDSRDRVAVASTYPNQYSGIPDDDTLALYEDRGVRTYVVYEAVEDPVVEDEEATEENWVPGYLEFRFPADGDTIDTRIVHL